jgi:hypothetical protein
MKKILLLLLLPALMSGQTVTSSCASNDSINSIYKADADRLALRRTLYKNFTYKDSIRIDPVLSTTYKRYLLAVYNATALPVRDTVFKLLNIHTGPVPSLNFFTIKANPMYQWVQNIQNSIYPTGEATVDALMNKYKLHESGYFQSQGYDLIRFRADSNYNVPPLANSFLPINGVTDADVETSFDDARDITDSINPGFALLNYSYGWGTCEDTCDHRRTWSFKIFTDCSVEYLGSTGDPLFVSIPRTNSIGMLKIYPNPVNDVLYISSPQREKIQYVILDVVGKKVRSWESDEAFQQISVGDLTAGVYYLRSAANVYKVIRE